MKAVFQLLIISRLAILSTSLIAGELTNDGPYVFEQSTERQAIWICDGEKMTQTITLTTPQTLENCGMQATLWPASINATLTTRASASSGSTNPDGHVYQGDFKIVAASDIHGQFDLFMRLLKSHGIIDSKNRWQFGHGHFVITGDVFDRGPKMVEALWFLYDLEKQAEQAGGKVHFLLGNHEVMVLNGDLRYLHHKYQKTANLLNTRYHKLFAANSLLGQWLRSRPVVVKINQLLFAHGGFHPRLVEENISLQTINSVFNATLVEDELDTKRDGLAKFLHGKHGPVWYRGYFQKKKASKQQVDALLNHFEVKHIVVGHTTQDKIETRYKGKVIEIDASMKNGKNGELLLWEKGKFNRGLISGKTIRLNVN